MPTKYGKTQKRVDRQTKKVTVEHEYIKCKSTADLIEFDFIKGDINIKMFDNKEKVKILKK